MKYLRANEKQFMNKQLRKAIMERTRLRNKFLTSKTTDSQEAYNKQRNLCVSLFRKAKKSYFCNLEVNKVTDNRQFWKTVGVLFKDRGNDSSNFTLIENSKLVTEDKELGEIFNNHFASLVPNMKLQISETLTSDTQHILDPVQKAIEKYKNHPSIKIIKNSFGSEQHFSFEPVPFVEFESYIKKMDERKSTQKNDVPTKIVKENSDIFAELLWSSYEQVLKSGKFPSELQPADITPVFKKDQRTDKANYRPVSILPNISKVLEKIMSTQMSKFFENILSKEQCGFRRGFDTQYCVL